MQGLGGTCRPAVAVTRAPGGSYKMRKCKSAKVNMHKMRKGNNAKVVQKCE